MTQKRAAILQILRESEGHLPADEIFRRAKELYPGIVLATVYNTLHYLTEEGHILHIRTADGPDFYDKDGCWTWIWATLPPSSPRARDFRSTLTIWCCTRAAPIANHLKL